MGLLRSPLLAGIRHGFSTREGGVSTGRYASMNLSRRGGDDLTRVEENRRLFALEGGFDLARLTTVRQVHGRSVLVADGHAPSDLVEREADGLCATAPGVAIAVLTADCVPLLLHDGKGRVAAVHAGWRGTVADIAGAAVEALVAAGARVEDLRAAMGPSIGPCCFEVGEEVAAPFEALVPPSVIREEDTPHVDLRRANRELLMRRGLAREHIDDLPPCTVCDEQHRFFSYRRDGAGIGQMLSFIVAATPES